MRLPSPRRAEHLLVLPVPFREEAGCLRVEAQARLGVERWLENFESLIVAAPVLREPPCCPTMTWVSAEGLEKRVQWMGLPAARCLTKFARHLAWAGALMRRCIERSRYLQFALGGPIGDWAAVAALQACLMGRPYSIHMDSVVHESFERLGSLRRGMPRTKLLLLSRLTAGYHRVLIGEAALALCQGEDCYQAYRRWARHAERVYDIQDAPEAAVRPASMTLCAKRTRNDEVLRVVYAGRMEEEKGPLHWLRAIALARDLGTGMRALWIGDGRCRPQVEAEARRLGIELRITGWQDDKQRVLAELSGGDLLLFTHLTPESPRCLIEALREGLPIIGYDSAYARELVSEAGGGVFVPCGDWRRLGEALAGLARDRAKLADLARCARRDGFRFTSAAVFQHRSRLIRRYLP